MTNWKSNIGMQLKNFAKLTEPYELMIDRLNGLNGFLLRETYLIFHI
jgi:hypothetical protein